MIYLTEIEIIEVNRYVLTGVGQTYQGIQYPAGLSLVVEQPQMVVFGHTLYPTIWLKAAYLMQKITKKQNIINMNACISSDNQDSISFHKKMAIVRLLILVNVVINLINGMIWFGWKSLLVNIQIILNQ